MFVKLFLVNHLTMFIFLPSPGYQNAILLDPSGQGVISPFLGYQRPGFAGLGPNGYLINGQNQFVVNRPYDLYQDPAAFGFQ